MDNRRVKMLNTHVATNGTSSVTYSAGHIYLVPADFAAELIAFGHAEAVPNADDSPAEPVLTAKPEPIQVSIKEGV